MEQMQTEISDRLKTKSVIGTITTGSTYVVTSSSIIRSVYIELPKRGPNANPADTFVRFSLDNQVEWHTATRGSRISIDGRPAADKIDLQTNASSAKFEMILLLDETGA